MLLEKNGRLGGSTAWSIGSITSTRTPHQLRSGIEDRPQDHYDDMPLFAVELAGRDNDELRRILCDEVPDAVRWLLDLGVRFFGPMPEPPHRQPRMHNVLPNSLSYIYHLERHARALAWTFAYAMRVSELITEGGAVVGAAMHDARRFARVTVSCWRWATSPMTPSSRRATWERSTRKSRASISTATGDGQKLALKLGARIVNGDLALGPEIRFIAPARRTLVRRLPPWPALAWTMEWAMRYAPQALLRPFIMGFLTTALAPSPKLFERGAVLINTEGVAFARSAKHRRWHCPTSRENRLHRDRWRARARVLGVAALRLHRAWHRLRLRTRLQAQPSRRLSPKPKHRRARSPGWR